MTFCFVKSFPLAVSTGAGAVSRKEIGIAVTGGMISGTLLSIFFF
jgi:multidrug efflux pump